MKLVFPKKNPEQSLFRCPVRAGATDLIRAHMCVLSPPRVKQPSPSFLMTLHV